MGHQEGGQGRVAHRAVLLTEYANGSCLPPLPLRCTLWEDSSILRALLVSGLFLNFSLQATHAVITGLQFNTSPALAAAHLMIDSTVKSWPAHKLS